jgi:hypothetical protein
MGECRSRGSGNCVVITTPCADDDPRWSAPLPLPTGVQGGPVDPRMVGTWELLINPKTDTAIRQVMQLQLIAITTIDLAGKRKPILPFLRKPP